MPQNTDFDITLFVDGGSRGNPGPAAIGAIIKKDGQEVTRISRFIGETTNNIAEYSALVEGLRRAAKLEATSIHVKADSELMVNQLLGKFKVKNEAIRPLYEEAVSILKKFNEVGIERIPREMNGEADALVNEALDAKAGKKKKTSKTRENGGLVGFLSDFGTGDAWAAVVKGVMKKVNPTVEIIDISHDVPAYDIRKGAFVLETAVEYIPATVFLAVVDPEVGGKRRGVIIGTTSGNYLVGPDNGLLMPAASRLGGAVEAYAISETVKADDGLSETFHARDIFGPTTARLAGGAAPAGLGEEIDRSSLIAAPYGRTDVAKGVVNAEIIDVDRYGTLRLNIRRRDAEPAGYKTGKSLKVIFEDGDKELSIVRTFSDVEPGAAMLLYDSSDYLCVSVNGAHAGLAFGLNAGDRLKLTLNG